MNTSHEIKGLIFDLDGTLIDSSPSILECFAGVLAREGIVPVTRLESRLIGPPLRKTMAMISGVDDPLILDRLVSSFKDIYDTEGFKATKVYDGIVEVLEKAFSLEIPMAIATNKRKVPTLKIIDHLGWGHYFRFVGTLDSIAPPHPDKASLIRSILGKMSISPETSVYVGDKEDDAIAAGLNGMPFVAALWGYGEWLGFNLEGCGLILKGSLPEDLLPFIDRGFCK